MTLKTKKAEPTIVKGMLAIPAATIARTGRQVETFPIGPMRYFSRNSNNLFIIYPPMMFEI